MNQTNTRFDALDSSVCALCALETVHAPGANLAWHRHREAYAALVLDGAYVEMSVDGRFGCSRGSVVIHPPNHAHSNEFRGKGARVLNIFLGNSRPDLDRMIVLKPRHFKQLEQLLRHDATLAGEAILEDSRSVAPNEPPAWLRAMAEFMADDGEPTSVTAAARRAGVSAPHASRVFTRFFGIPPTRFRREYRLRRALALLKEGTSPAVAAAAAGFSDQSHLGRVVRRELGATPAQLRR